MKRFPEKQQSKRHYYSLIDLSSDLCFNILTCVIVMQLIFLIMSCMFNNKYDLLKTTTYKVSLCGWHFTRLLL